MTQEKELKLREVGRRIVLASKYNYNNNRKISRFLQPIILLIKT